MSRADDLIARFEERNKDKLADEATDAVLSRIVCFTKVELLRSFLQLALVRAVVLLRVPRDCVEAAFEVNEETGATKPAIKFTKDVELPCDATLIASVMGRFFKAITIEWSFELDHAKADEESFQQVGEWCANNPETPEAFARRLRKWSA